MHTVVFVERYCHGNIDVRKSIVYKGYEIKQVVSISFFSSVHST